MQKKVYQKTKTSVQKSVSPKEKEKKPNSWSEAKLLIGTANVICGEATWSPLIKTKLQIFESFEVT